MPFFSQETIITWLTFLIRRVTPIPAFTMPGLSLQICRKQEFSEYALYASSLLTNIYESQHNSDSTIKYMKIMLASKDSVLGQSKVKEFQKVVFDDEQRTGDCNQAGEI